MYMTNVHVKVFTCTCMHMHKNTDFQPCGNFVHVDSGRTLPLWAQEYTQGGATILHVRKKSRKSIYASFFIECEFYM